MSGFVLLREEFMIEVRNLKGKKVCNVDPKKKIIEIIIKGEKTIIRVKENGDFEIAHVNI